MKATIVVFPGSNCDRDTAVAVRTVTGAPPAMVWHRETSLPPSDVIILPGGFSYGDYLRPGAIAARSPIMQDVISRARAGTPTLGICNGLQVLLETGLLPGVLRRNRDRKMRPPAAMEKRGFVPQETAAVEPASFAAIVSISIPAISRLNCASSSRTQVGQVTLTSVR